MPQPFTRWKVLPHGKLTAIDADILTVVGDIPMPVGNMKRRMTVVRLRGGRLVVFSAIALDEAEMRALEDFGALAFLIVSERPSSARRLGSGRIAIPGLHGGGAGRRAQGRSPKWFPSTPPWPISSAIPTSRPSALRERATARWRWKSAKPDGVTLVLNDIVANIRDAHGFGGWLLRMMGFAGDEAHGPLPVKMTLLQDQAALAAQQRQWAGLELKRVMVSHGETIEADPQRVLRNLALSLE